MQHVLDDTAAAQRDLPTRFRTVEDYAATYEGVEGRFELVDGEAVRLAAECIIHGDVKAMIGLAFGLALRDSGAPLRLLIDGPTIKVSSWQARQSDLMILHRRSGSPRDVVTTDPLLVVEVMSESSVRTDTFLKLVEYFTVPSISHYLVVDPESRLVTWHRRRPDGAIGSSAHADGTLAFTDLGIALDVGSIWPPD